MHNKKIIIFGTVAMMLLITFVLADYGDLRYGRGRYGFGEQVIITPAKKGISPEDIASVTSAMTQDLCLQSKELTWYNGECYECSGEIVDIEGELKCAECPEGFTFQNGECTTKVDRKIPIWVFVAVGVLGIVALSLVKTRKKYKKFKKNKKIKKEIEKIERNNNKQDNT